MLAQLGQLARWGSGPSRIRASAVLTTVSLAGNGANHGTIAAFTGRAPFYLAAAFQIRVHNLEHRERTHIDMWASRPVLNTPRHARLEKMRSSRTTHPAIPTMTMT